MVYGVLGEGELVPGHEDSPLHSHPHAILHVGDGPIFCHIDHLMLLD